MLNCWSKSLMMQKDTVILTVEFLSFNSSLYSIIVDGKNLAVMHYDIEKRLSENGKYYDSWYIWKLPVKKNSQVTYSIAYKDTIRTSSRSLTVYSGTTQTNGIIDIAEESVMFPLALQDAQFYLYFSMLNENSENIQIIVNDRIFNLPTYSETQLLTSVSFFYYANLGEVINYSFTDGLFSHTDTVTAPKYVSVNMSAQKVS